MDMAAINEQVIHDHRAGGPIGVKEMHRERIALLTTVGRSSGEQRTAPMMFLPSDDGVLLVASANASPSDPDWVLNVVADPRVHIELPDAEWDGIATVIEGDRREREWEKIVEGFPFFADHQAKVDRTIPIVEVVPET